jgi:hypothetical protein
MLINPKDIEVKLDEILTEWNKISGDSSYDNDSIYQYGDIIYTNDSYSKYRIEVDFNIVADMDRQDVLDKFNVKLDYDPYVKIDIYENEEHILSFFEITPLIEWLSF